MIPIQFRPPATPKGARGFPTGDTPTGPRGWHAKCNQPWCKRPHVTRRPGASQLMLSSSPRPDGSGRRVRGERLPATLRGMPGRRPISGAESGSARFVAVTNRDFRRKVGSQLQHAVSSQSRQFDLVQFAPTALAEERLPAKVYSRPVSAWKVRIYPISTPSCNRILLQIGLFDLELHPKPPNGLAELPRANPVGPAGIPPAYESGARGGSARTRRRPRPTAPPPRSRPTSSRA